MNDYFEQWHYWYSERPERERDDTILRDWKLMPYRVEELDNQTGSTQHITSATNAPTSGHPRASSNPLPEIPTSTPTTPNETSQ